MSNIIWAILPFVFIIAIYVLIFTRKGEFERIRKSWRRYDWMTFFSAIFGGVLLSSAMRASGIQIPNAPWLLLILTLLIAVPVIVALVRRARTGRPIVQLMGDERTELLLAKSARNAFFATYLALFIHLCITEASTLEAESLLIVLASGLFVLIVSLPLYFFKKS